MESEQDSRKRKLAALKARREQGNLANAALVDQEEVRFVRFFMLFPWLPCAGRLPAVCLTFFLAPGLV